MGIKIRSNSSNPYARPKREVPSKHGSQHEDCVTVGEGEFAVMTMPRHGGTSVVHLFKTQEEANAQLERNIAQDKPLVGFDKFE